MFPRHVLKHIVSKGVDQGLQSVDSVAKLATSHDLVSIMFMDIVGFTTMSKEVAPQQVMIFLNSLFTLLDELTDQYQVYKVETAGDCYIVAGGLMTVDENGFFQVDPHADAQRGAEKVMAFSKALLRCAKTVNMPHNGEPTTVRVGIHTGPVVSGLIGSKLPKFSIFGDTMNTASRMESTSQPGCIQVSEVTQELLKHHTFSATGGIEVKGKGLMNTYIWSPDSHPDEQYVTPMEKNQEEAVLLHHICKSMISNVLSSEAVTDLSTPENSALQDNNSSASHALKTFTDYYHSGQLPVLRKGSSSLEHQGLASRSSFNATHGLGNEFSSFLTSGSNLQYKTEQVSGPSRDLGAGIGRSQQGASSSHHMIESMLKLQDSLGESAVTRENSYP
ncbi:hypothetical protein CEUSTIGMA_g9789.t1 [Chlamydomonas eustigma]|uniref:Guanylate cyclase domain-containing protein n=1 Tax=Chlamydomonas eustigma TaxID=1157962 RepID=A0A250XHT3_9CHLO|nr:hypothetical protein CEUSTIGMA_g9789.t1 [Chlamydomonas eustigma]|eukprot:GAX82360.1 hypothetical protein CEUSTIGMA_g9789.t1 [Chlamydomonas eustigma]